VIVTPSRPRTTILAVAAAFLILANADLSTASESAIPPSVRFSEIGNRGTVYAPSPPLVDGELSAAEDFEGELELVLVATRDREWRPVNISEIARATYPLSLSAGERRPFRIAMPSLNRYSLEKNEVGLSWRLIDSERRAILAGREGLRAVDAPAWWGTKTILHVSSDHLGSADGIGPTEAYDSVVRYSPFTHAVIAAADFESLGVTQRQTLLDAVSLGLILMLHGPIGSHPSADEPWQSLGRLIWRSDSGAELFEAQYGAGLVRRLGLSLAQLMGGPEGLRILAFSRQPVRPMFWPPDLTAPNDLSPLDLREMAPAGAEDRLTAWAGEIQSRGIVSFALVLSFVAGISYTSRRISSKKTRSDGRTLILFCVLAVVSPLALLFIFSPFPAGNLDYRFDMSLHGPNGHASVRVIRGLVGGGGGTIEPRFVANIGDRSVFSSTPRINIVYQSDYRHDGSVSLGLPGARSSADRMVAYGLFQAVDPDPAWECSLEWRGDGSLKGRLVARRDLAQAVVLAGSSAVRLGNIRQGEEVDLAFLADALQRPASGKLTSLEHRMVTDAFETLNELAGWYQQSSRWLGDFAIAAELSNGAASTDGERRLCQFQAFVIPGGRPSVDHRLFSPVSWSYHEGVVEICVPSVFAEKVRPGEVFDLVTSRTTTNRLVTIFQESWAERVPGTGLPNPDSRADGLLIYELAVGYEAAWDESNGVIYIAARGREES
jgi:hypothetical protein